MLIDGGLATHLEALGYDISGSLWSARVLTEAPGGIVRAHRDFISAGARIVITASYQVSRQGFLAQGRTEAHADAALVRSIDLARQAVEEAGRDGVLVAASVGPYGAITHDGGEYRGRYGLSHDQLVDFHGERIAVLAAAQPDLLAIETIPDADEAAAIADVLVDYPDLPAWITFSCGDERTTWAGQAIEDAMTVASRADSVMAAGVNCVHPALVAGLLERAGRASDLPLVAYPNVGRVWLPDTETWTDPEGSGSAQTSPPPGTGVQGWPVADWFDAGARLIGGCCCVEPADITALALELTEC